MWSACAASGAIFAYRRAALRALFAGDEPTVTPEDRAAVTITEEPGPLHG